MSKTSNVARSLWMESSDPLAWPVSLEGRVLHKHGDWQATGNTQETLTETLTAPL